ncbi:MAG: Eco57I restriction-modification methylase domain-containing protein [Eubacteriales bacterium]|uniref:Eco57I restriction-modification methylase domain-containing protein n=1 Tax=Fenollaria sp. TaxID=1965292 RepID=UPI002A750E35|nr:Eco57I restriction-modification methylase domain-containing protein [Fenollaria sp.]MDD7340123.1 Eco57I restriction-modification methylase domain-containing protein [Eubacteriales bacterium]MDY3105542.1 Eco57I restriction-modification methylase domain-containing protein [Fenollaria sp.]
MQNLIDIKSHAVDVTMNILLKDRTSNENIILATDDYKGYNFYTQITKKLLLDGKLDIRPRVSKSIEAQNKRTKKKAEVFTPCFICNKMNNFLDEEWLDKYSAFNNENDINWTTLDDKIEFSEGKTWKDYVLSRRLEITCGEAPYLVSRYDAATGEIIPVNDRIGILDRKLRVIGENVKSKKEWLTWVYRAYESTYGYEFQGDNLLIARINLLETFVEYMEERWGETPSDSSLKRIARIITYNIWQMDGIRDVLPYSGANEFLDLDVDPNQTDLFGLIDTNLKNKNKEEVKLTHALIYDWKKEKPFLFIKIKECEEMKFDYVIGNPPYQKESETSFSKTNKQKPMTNIFQYFQKSADEISTEGTCLIYPGIRWIHQSGKGLKKFGQDQINDKNLDLIYFFEDAREVFGKGIELSDGITIVLKLKENQKKDGFDYIFDKNGKKTKIRVNYPGDSMFIINPDDVPIADKIKKAVKENKISYLSNSILSRSLFNIESDFVDKNPKKVKLYDGNNVNYDKGEIKVLTNDRAGKGGRATWYVINKSEISKNKDFISKWKVVVSSASPGGQKRDSQLEIIDNHSIFGRARLAINIFDTKEEAENFYNYMNTNFIKYTFLLTDEALASLGKLVPDITNYTNDNGIINFSEDIDSQLFKLFNLSDEEIDYIKTTVNSQRNKGDERNV